MPTGSAPPDPGRDGDPARRSGVPEDPLYDGPGEWRLLPSGEDWMDDAQWEACLASRAGEQQPDDPDPCQDPDCGPPPGLDDAELAGLIAEARELSADEARAAAQAARLGTLGALAAIGASAGRRGPEMPGSARTLPGEHAGPAGSFATGMVLDTAPGSAVLAQFATDAAGDDDRYAGASDDELLGAVCAWDRVEAHASARKHAAVAELIRRRPAPGCPLEGPAGMPAGWDEFAPAELASALGEGREAVKDVLGLAQVLEVLLPGTRAAFRAGVLSERKAGIIADAVVLLDPDQARAAEGLVLGRAGSLTPAGLRAAIARAVMEVAPDKARKRREAAARHARVERWAEASGNAALAGRELPPAQVLAADQRVTWWAEQLKKAGLDGGMDELRARAYLDILLGMDSRPDDATAGGGDARGRHGPDGPGDHGSGLNGPGGHGSGPGGPGGHGSGLGTPTDGGPLAGVIPPGFAGRTNLTVPLVTLLQLADRPGELAGIGPIDPALALDLADAAARTPRSTWCVTVTDQNGYAIGHGCARPAPAGLRKNRVKRDETDSGGGHDPPPGTTSTGRAGFAFTADGQHGPPGGYGTWLLSTGASDLVVAVGPIATGECDHRYQAKGHNPGLMLRHLTQVRHATCTGPACRRPATRCDFEHDIPYEAGGRTCLCNGDPKCRSDHRLKQDSRWKVDLLPGGYVRWTTPAGRQYTTEPTRYPI